MRATRVALALACASILSASAARADDGAVIWPTLTPTGDGPTGGPLRRPDDKDGALAERARELDVVLADAAQDLGLALTVGAPLPGFPRPFRDGDVVEAAQTSPAWIVSPRLERDGSDLVIRIVAVPPKSKVALVRSERVSASDLPTRAVVMLRDLVNAKTGKTEAEVVKPTRIDAALPARSSGRPVFAASSAVFGGFIGYSLQKASRSDDPRLLYPLMALGTGVGLGASMIVADEWDVGVGDAWVVTGGMGWGAASGFFFAAGYDVRPLSDRYVYGLAGGAAGTALAASVLARHGASDGQALFTHSGAAFGTGIGAGIDVVVTGSTKRPPYRGLGYGSAIGLVVGGGVASFVSVPEGRVLTLDLGAGLGALAGAAAGSPFLFKDPSKNDERAFAAITLGGTVLGTGVAAWLSRDGKEAPRPLQRALLVMPSPGVVAVTERPGASPVPAYGMTWQGRWR